MINKTFKLSIKYIILIIIFMKLVYRSLLLLVIIAQIAQTKNALKLGAFLKAYSKIKASHKARMTTYTSLETVTGSKDKTAIPPEEAVRM